MALFGLPPEVMRPVALALNVLVAGLTTYRFYKAGHLKFSEAWPLLLMSAPLAFVGGTMVLPQEIYRLLLGGLLILSAGYLIWRSLAEPDRFSENDKILPKVPALGTGGTVGFLSGLTGIGGGVLLSPVLLQFGWAGIRKASALSAVFILFNSAAGLAGNLVSLNSLPTVVPIWAVAAMLGGLIGSRGGALAIPSVYLIRILSVVLLAAGLKFVIF
jgi:hypothetical protein